ncbi:hypothetical protein SADUNF_Sadunf10G0065000 [Salix dunnii]|uniref:Uncharacterized protein n=1 Tax=Salix dunnii TaxID=1413687 RepID=A0A835JSL4_9ROSI|nr:hypothetical protein SADUNF_Sadunf10G0065000 [Salix dunnii]
MEASPSCWILDSGWQAGSATSMLTLKHHNFKNLVVSMNGSPGKMTSNSCAAAKVLKTAWSNGKRSH